MIGCKMKATVPYIEQKFEEFNQRMFAGKLPKLPIELSNAKTFLGVCVYKIRKGKDGKKIFYDFRLRINTRIDLSEAEIEDTIIHEMIHYYIGYHQLVDSSAHGPLFLHIMNTINEKFGRHLSVSHKGTRQQMKQAIDTKPRWHVIAVITLKDNRCGLKVLPRVLPSILHYYNNVRKSDMVTAIQLYMSNDIFFNQFPSSKALKFHIQDREEVMNHLKETEKLTCDGRTIKRAHQVPLP